MKRIIKTVVICATIALVGFNFTSCEEWFEGKKSVEEVAKEHGKNIEKVSVTLTDYVIKQDAFINSNFETMSIEEIRKVFEDYLEAGEIFCETYLEMFKYQEENRQVFSMFNYNENNVTPGTRSTAGDITCEVLDAVLDNPTSLGIGTVKQTGESIKEARETYKKTTKKYDEKVKKGELTREEANFHEIEEHKKNKLDLLQKTVTIGAAAIVGGGAALLAGSAISAAGVTGVALWAGASVVGAGASWICTKLFGKKSTKSGGIEPSVWIATGKIKQGEPLPLNLIPDGSTLIFNMEGYAPMVINDFSVPGEGVEREITMNPVKPNELKKGAKAEYCYLDKKLQVRSCDEVWYINATHFPQNPGVGVPVTVTATLMPPAKGCNIHFSIVGTDGYTDEQTKKSDNNGKATFNIPGAEKGVFDKVTITSSNGKKQIVTYTFGL